MSLTAEPSPADVAPAPESDAAPDQPSDGELPEYAEPVAAHDSRWPSPLVLAACASIGAGGIHASVVGAHGEHRLLATLFVWAAAFQVLWGIAVLVRRVESARTLIAAGLIGNLGLAVVWLITRLAGISAIDGLEVREQIQFADATAAGLAIVAAGIALGALLTPGSADDHRLANVSIPAFLVACLALPAMITGGTHLHQLTDTVTTDHGHTATLAPGLAATGSADTTANHGHPTDTTVASAPAPTNGSSGSNGTTESAPAATTPATTPEPASAVPTAPYDPTKPLNFGGVDGVTPEQQARAENLVAITLNRLPKFADPAVAESLGWHSIGDGVTGYEHYLNQATFADGRMLDPDFPESLVYRIEGGTKTLVSAMFMAEPGLTLETIPDIGGRLTQWHIHDNLCFTADPVAPQVVGLTLPDGTCAAPFVRGAETPMIHVWIASHPCGPFAALEGVGAGQILPGETRWCDHAHGTGTTG